MTSTPLDAFSLYYEHHENCPMKAAERRAIKERRDLIKWFKCEIVFLILSFGIKSRRNHVTTPE